MIVHNFQLAQLKSVNSVRGGIVKSAAAMLIVFTQGFKLFKNHRQLISFTGLAAYKASHRIYRRGWQKLEGCVVHVQHECYENKHGLSNTL